jgi:hypothetical protein
MLSRISVALVISASAATALDAIMPGTPCPPIKQSRQARILSTIFLASLAAWREKVSNVIIQTVHAKVKTISCGIIHSIEK